MSLGLVNHCFFIGAAFQLFFQLISKMYFSEFSYDNCLYIAYGFITIVTSYVCIHTGLISQSKE